MKQFNPPAKWCFIVMTIPKPVWKPSKLYNYWCTLLLEWVIYIRSYFIYWSITDFSFLKNFFHLLCNHKMQWKLVMHVRRCGISFRYNELQIIMHMKLNWNIDSDSLFTSTRIYLFKRQDHQWLLYLEDFSNMRFECTLYI